MRAQLLGCGLVVLPLAALCGMPARERNNISLNRSRVIGFTSHHTNIRPRTEPISQPTAETEGAAQNGEPAQRGDSGGGWARPPPRGWARRPGPCNRSGPRGSAPRGSRTPARGGTAGGAGAARLRGLGTGWGASSQLVYLLGSKLRCRGATGPSARC